MQKLLRGYRDNMRLEIEGGIALTASTVADLRALPTWPNGLIGTGAPVQAVQRSAIRTKLKEIVGLYVNPPDHAIILSVDEKSQIQALHRTQPGLPMKKVAPVP